MTDLLVTFEDGTTELRPANTPALASYASIGAHPNQFIVADVVPARPEPIISFRRPGKPGWTHALSAWRENDALVWCITGQDLKTKVLTGEWRCCYVEAAHEQIERLTRERDAARSLIAAIRERAEREAAWSRELFANVRGCDPSLAASGAWGQVLEMVKGQAT